MQRKNKPKGFTIYCDTYEHIELLSMQMRGELLTALYEYANTGKRTEFKDAGLRMAFSFLRSQMERDFEKYEVRCERNREIAKNREQKRKVNQSSPNVTTGNQYKEKDKDKEKNKDKDKDKEKDKEKASAKADPVADAADVLTLYNSICVSLPKESVLTEEAVRLIMRSPQVDFEDYFKRIERSDFLTGRSGKWNGCTLGWLLRPDTIAKVQSGYYDDRKKTRPPKASYDITELDRIDTLDWVE